MFPNLSPGAIGIRAGIQESIDLAKAVGFKGVDFDLGQVEGFGAEKLRDLCAAEGLRIGGWGLPVDYQGTDEAFRTSLANLPAKAALAAKTGCTAFSTWMLSGSNDLTFGESFDRMKSRFREIGLVLANHGCRLGIEFLGPKTIRDGFEYEFIHTLPGMIELCDAAGTGNPRAFARLLALVHERRHAGRDHRAAG